MSTPSTPDSSTDEERKYAAKARRQLDRVGLNARSIERFISEVVEEDLHAKTILSLSLGTLGVLHAASLCIHVVGRAMAWARGADPKHCIKQFDRMLSNSHFTPWAIARQWAAFALGERQEAWVALDWTEFDADDQATLCAYLVTRHGRATPLLWKTVGKSTLKGRRNQYEDELLEKLRECIPETVTVTITADRGFGDQKRYEQTLIVTSGRGLHQRWGGPIEEIRPGDVVTVGPNEKHWHGAAPTTAMTHIAIQESLDGKAVDWLEKVTDEQYRGSRSS